MIYFSGCIAAFIMSFIETIRNRERSYRFWGTLDFFVSVFVLTLFSWVTVVIFIREIYLDYKDGKKKH